MSKPSPWWRAPAAADSAETTRNINVQLKPAGVRKATSDQVIARLRRKTSGMPGATMFLQNSQDVRIGGRQGNAQYQYTLQAPDFATLALWGPKVLDQLSQIPEIADVSSDQQNSGLVVERDHRSRYRVAPRPDGASGGLRALRRLRPAPGLGDVQVDQSVPRRSGAAAAMVGKPGLPENDLRADPARHRRSAVDVRALHARDHAHFAAAPGSVSGNHAFVQPRRRRLAERRRDGDQPGRSGDGPARQHHRQVRRHRAGLSGLAARISPS